MEFVKKTAMGYKETTVAETTNVILTKLEYDEQLRKIELAEADKKATQNKSDAEIKKVQNDSLDIQDRMQREFQTQLDSAKTLSAERAERIAILEGLNQNLLRINKERANSERGLEPKKEHTGYIELHSRDFIYSCKFAEKQHAFKAPALKVTLQTPFTCEFTRDQVRDSVLASFASNLAEIFGCQSIVRGPWIPQGQSEEAVRQEWTAKKMVFQFEFDCNGVSGFWDVIFLANFEVLLPPEVRKVKKD